MIQKLFEQMTSDYTSPIETISRSEFFKIINEIPNGAMYSVYFVKKDKTLRQLRTVKGTKRGVKGVGLSYNPAEKGLLILFDMDLKRKGLPDDKCWRSVTYSTIYGFAWAGRRFKVV